MGGGTVADELSGDYSLSLPHVTQFRIPHTVLEKARGGCMEQNRNDAGDVWIRRASQGRVLSQMRHEREGEGNIQELKLCRPLCESAANITHQA